MPKNRLLNVAWILPSYCVAVAVAVAVAAAKQYVCENSPRVTGRETVACGPITAEQELRTAQAAYNALPARLPLGEVNPEQQVLETELKQLLHGFRMAAYNIMMMLVSEIRVNTSYKAASTKAHNLVRQFLKHTSDLDPRHPGYLDVILDPMPTNSETTALTELCEQLTATQSMYPGTNRVLRYRVKT